MTDLISSMERTNEKPLMSVDEFTIAFLYPENKNYNDVDPLKFIENVYTYLEFDIMGKLEKTSKNLSSYNQSYVVAPYEFPKFSYHEKYASNGIALRFSASSLSTYIELYNATVEAYNTLKISKRPKKEMSVVNLIKELYNIAESFQLTPRLSRIDISADVFNDNLTVDNIASLLSSNQIIPKSRYIDEADQAFKYKSAGAKITTITNDGETNTIYVGSKKSKTGFLRIYNKKLEQTTKGIVNGRHYFLAQQLSNWVRWEAVFRDTYAHQIGDILNECSNRNYTQTLAACFNKRYSFVINNQTKTKDKTMNFTLITPELHNIELNTNEFIPELNIATKSFRITEKERIKALFLNSQFQNTLYKARMLFSEDDFNNLVAQAIEYNQTIFQPSENVEKEIQRLIKVDSLKQASTEYKENEDK